MGKTYKGQLAKTYRALIGESGTFNQVPLTTFNQQMYKSCVTAALVKCLEFNLEINTSRNNRTAFHLMSFLRGMCEDLITLTYIHRYTASEREHLIKIYMAYLKGGSVVAQETFFQKVRPFQPLISLGDANAHTQNALNDLKTFWSSKGFNKDKSFPSVENMAIDAKLKDLYDFLYHATSRTVHFSPNVLLRTGWYSNEEAIIRFSVHNFVNYHALFNMFYGSYLFVRFARTFKKFLGLSTSFMLKVRDVEEVLEEFIFYPEIITFEELNLKRPDNVSYKAIQMAYEMPPDERKAFVEALPEILQEVRSKITRRKNTTKKKSSK